METQNVVSEGVKGLNEREGRGHFRFQKLSERVRGIRSVNASREVAWSESLDDAAASSGGLGPRGSGRTAAEAGALDGTFFLAKLKEVAEVNTTGQCTYSRQRFSLRSSFLHLLSVHAQQPRLTPRDVNSSSLYILSHDLITTLHPFRFRSHTVKEFCLEVFPYVQSTPLLLHNLDKVVSSLLRHVSIPKTLAIRPLLELTAMLARELRHVFYPHFENVVKALLKIADPSLPEQTAEIFRALSLIFKHLSKQILADPRSRKCCVLSVCARACVLSLVNNSLKTHCVHVATISRSPSILRPDARTPPRLCPPLCCRNARPPHPQDERRGSSRSRRGPPPCALLVAEREGGRRAQGRDRGNAL